MYEFRWNDWNVDHIGKHGVSAHAVEYVVNQGLPPYPKREGEGKYRVRGQTRDGHYLQVIYIFSPEDVVYVVHARPLTEAEKRNFRRTQR